MPGIAFSAISAGIFEAAIAGAAALRHSSRTLLETKSDGSPLTPADIASDTAIRSVLQQRFPSIAVVSEESRHDLEPDFATRPFFLVDPLDGTKEFLQGRQDFAVCIGLVVAQRSVAGIIVAPALLKVWQGWLDNGQRHAEKAELDSNLKILPSSQTLLTLSDLSLEPRVFTTSRSHNELRSARLMGCFPGARHVPMGAALKFTAVADGDACLYPRGAGSMEWDTAAGEAILCAAGGYMAYENGEPPLYGNAAAGFRNGPFIAGRSEAIVRHALAQWAAC